MFLKFWHMCLVCVASRVCSAPVMDLLTSVMVMLVELSLNIQ
jgi:hypothetical protein